MTARLTSSGSAGSAAAKRLQLLVAQHDEQDEVALEQGADRVEHQLGADRVGELGEDDDQRAAVEARRQGRERQRVIGLAGRIVDPGGDPLQHREGARRREIGWLDARGCESKPNRPTRSPSFSATKAVSRAAETARSIARHAGERLAHRPAGIERHDDIVVALGAIFLGDQAGVAGRLLPVDRAPVHALAIVGERLELGALADLELRLHARASRRG